MADSPRPFVFRGRHLDAKSFGPGETFWFDVNIFSREPEVMAYFVLSFASLAREGLGPSRGRCDLTRVHALNADGSTGQTYYEGGRGILAKDLPPLALSLNADDAAPTRLRVDFLTPTEMKHEQKVVDHPSFPVLLSRARDRISALRQLYGEGPLDVDFAGLRERAAKVQLTDYHFAPEHIERKSTRTGQTHGVGGYIGYAEYEGDLAEFLPYLVVAGYTGVGRQAVWGKGEIGITRALPSRDRQGADAR